MPKIKYRDIKFKPETLATIQLANSIIVAYVEQGYSITVRSIYYQMVARGHIPNSLRSYKNFASTIDNARVAGLVDWLHIVDNTRSLRENGHWTSPADIIQAARDSYRVDLWEGQEYMVECWVEKDALVGVIDGVCRRLDVPYFACRGYVSQSEMWNAARRMQEYIRNGQTPVILHLGDHDPSGVDMTRDILDRLDLYMGGIEIDRLALNWEQIEQYNPPPNPAKTSDSRAGGYLKEFGNQSWELDALEPTVLAQLIENAVVDLRDEDAWSEAMARQREGRTLLAKVASNWNEIVESLADFGDEEEQEGDEGDE